MPLSLVNVAVANFRTDEKSDEMNTQFMSRMGVKVRYLPARLAIARSLALEGTPPGDTGEHEQGKSIKGDTLFGTGALTAVWTSLIVERAASEEIDLKSLQELVGAHWRRGIRLLNEDWESSDNDPARFVQRLMAAAPGNVRKRHGNVWKRHGNIGKRPGNDLVTSGNDLVTSKNDMVTTW